MRKYIYQIIEGSESKFVEFITDRTSNWTKQQYLRNRVNTTMNLISDEATEEKEAVSREIELG